MATGPSLPRGCQRDRGPSPPARRGGEASAEQGLSNYRVPGGARPNRCSRPHAAARSSPSLAAVAGARPCSAARAGRRPGVRRSWRASRPTAPSSTSRRREIVLHVRRRGRQRQPGHAWPATATRSRRSSQPTAQRRQPDADRRDPRADAGRARATSRGRSAQPSGEAGASDRFSFEILVVAASSTTATTVARRHDRRRRPTAADDAADQSTRRRRRSTPRRSPTARPGSGGCCRRSAWPCCSARSCSSSRRGRRDPSTSSPCASCARCGCSTLVGTLLYVVALERGRQGRVVRQRPQPGRRGSTCSTPAGPAGPRWPGSCSSWPACWVVLRPERVIDPTTQLPAIALPTLAVITLGLSRTGGDLAILGVVAGIAHALAMAVWVGGVVLLARVVLAGPGEEDLVHAVRGFNRISGPAIVVTVVSGLVQLYRLDGGSLFSEPPRPGAAAEDGAGGGDAVRRPHRPPGRPGPPGPGRRPDPADGRPPAPGVRHRGR